MTHDSADRRDSPESAHRAHGGLARPGAAAIAVGDVIAAKYRITSIIGKGGMGVVVAAEHLQLRETVALKFLLHEGDDGQAFRARFVREAQVSAKLRGEHVARLMDFGAPEHGPPFIVMEYLAGTDLREVLARRGRLPTEIALDYLAQACEGVAEAHALGVVHRDLKPSNLFLCKRLDGSDLLKVLDFGVSKQRSGDDDEITSAGVVLGSPRYMAPEQLRSSIDVDARADVWSLGAIFYEMLAGRPPFRADSTPALCALILGTDPPPSLRDLAPDVDPAVERAILRCLERDRDARTPDVASLLVELADATDVAWLRGAAARTAAVLERRSQRADTNPAFSPSTPMVAYTSSPRGSTSGISTATAPPRSAGTSGPVVAPRSAIAAEPPRRSPLVFAAMLLIVAAGVGATVLLTRSPGTPAAAVPAVPAKTGGTPAASAAEPSPAVAVTSSEVPARPVPDVAAPGSAQPGASAPIRASARPAANVAKRPASPAPAPAPAPAPTTKTSRPLDDRF